MRIALQPFGSRSAQKHFVDTIETPVPLEQTKGILPTTLYETLETAYPSGSAPIWGVAPGTRDLMVGTYRQLSVGDLVLFSGNKQISWSGVVRILFHSPELARELWGEAKDGSTWEYMYALGDGRKLEIPVSVLNKAASYSPDNPIQRFIVMDETKSASVSKSLQLDSRPTSYIDFAADAFFVLKKCAAERRKITYGELGSAVGAKTPRQVGSILSPIQTYCLKERLPPLTILGVSKSTGLPGEGFIATKPEEIARETRRVFDFDWESVGNQFGTPSFGAREQGAVRSAEVGSKAGTSAAPTGREGEATYIMGGAKIKRDRDNPKWVKAEHDFTCQLCHERLETPLGPYAEGSHIIPLGEPFLGKDKVENMLCLCPNCHVRFDTGARTVDEKFAVRINPGDKKIGSLRRVKNHDVSSEALAWHRNEFIAQ